MRTVNALIVGAGVIGSSVAFHLARLGMTDILVIDPDLEGSLSSSELNAGGVRATFSQPINVQMSKLSIEYFAQHAEDVGYRGVGYLWLKTPDALRMAKMPTEIQRALGWPVEEWSVADLRGHVPFVDKTDDLGGALFAPHDGLVNPNLVKLHYRAEAKKLGVIFEDRLQLEELEEVSETAADISCRRLRPMSQSEKLDLFSRGMAGSAKVEIAGEPERIRARAVVNCAGAWAAPVARILGYDSPTQAVRRQVSIFDCRDVDLSTYGMIVDTSGVYFHPEAMNGLAGFAVHEEKAGFNFEYDGEIFFNEHIWPALYERSSLFERLKHITGWAGLYDVSPDESAIIGRAARGKRLKFERVFEAHSFSGHGVMHSHAAGTALAEMMVDGKYLTIDATGLDSSRFTEGRRLPEGAVI